MTLQDLIERLEKATGPDRDLDFAMFEAFVERVLCATCGYLDRPYYTSSIDAALTLVPERMGWQVNASHNGESFYAFAFVGRGSYEEAATPAIALCIAALKARTALAQDRRATEGK